MTRTSELIGPEGGTGFVSEKNSTRTPMAAGETFTGDWEEVAIFSQINTVIRTDVASAINGYTLEFSMRGTVGSGFRAKTFTVSPNTSQAHTLASIAEFFRVVYINGSTDQTEFEIECIYHVYQSKPLTSTATETIGDFSDVLLVRQSGDHALDAARGVVTDHAWVYKFGHNTSVGATEEAIWEVGGDYTGFLTSGVQIEVLSSDATDTSGGVGAQTVVLEGLDDNFEAITETLTMNGTSAVTTAATNWIRLSRVFAENVGTYSTTNPSTTGANVGSITVRVAGAGANLCLVDPQVGQSEIAVYTVPRGLNGYLKKVIINVSSGSQKAATVSMWQRRNADDASTPFTGRRVVLIFEDIQGERAASFDFSVPFSEMTDIWFSAVRTDNQDAQVDVNFELLVVPNTALPPVP